MAFAIAASLTISACSDDDPTGTEPEPEVQQLILTAGANTLTIDRTIGGPTPAGSVLTIPLGATPITAVVRKADGSVETLVTGAEFDIRISPTTGTPFTWAPNATLGGTLTTAASVTSGQNMAATVDLFHRAEGHADFGPYPITIRAQ
jgi:hypothetical protein